MGSTKNKCAVNSKQHVVYCKLHNIVPIYAIHCKLHNILPFPHASLPPHNFIHGYIVSSLQIAKHQIPNVRNDDNELITNLTGNVPVMKHRRGCDIGGVLWIRMHIDGVKSLIRCKEMLPQWRKRQWASG